MMAVGNHIVTDASSRPTITMVQDCLIAVYLMTKRDILFDDAMAKWVLANESSPPRYYGIGWRTSKTSNWNHRYSGKQILSQLLAPINLQRQVRGSADMDIFTFDRNETTVYIRNGALLCGRLCKESMNGSGGIIHITCKDFGNREAQRFMSKGGRLLHRWFESYGFSIGIDDISCTEESYADVNKIINVALENIQKANDTYIKFGSHPNHRIQLENHTIKTLQDVLPRCGQSILEGMHENNALRCMAKGCGSGSKGSKMNIAQVHVLNIF
jgi:DNA-directed RNA polymerase beta' subunit